MTILIFHTDCRNRVKFIARDLHGTLWILCKFHKIKQERPRFSYWWK